MHTHSIPLHEISQNIIIHKIEESEHLNFNGLHRHNFYEILYFTQSNNSSHAIDFVKQPVRSDCLYLLKPRQVYEMVRTDQKGFLIAIQADYFNSLRSNLNHYLHYALPSIIPLDESDLTLTEEIIRSTYKELSERQRQELVNTHINTLITLCLLSFKDRIKESGIDSRVLELVALIDIHYLSERELSFYAKNISLSEKRLGVLTKQAFGKTVKQMIQARILLESKRLISYDNLPFKNIAFQLGFKDASYFSRFFKIYSGITPEQFRNSLK